MRLFIVMLLFSPSVWARPQWADVEIEQSYRLTHNFTFPDGFTIARGENVLIVNKWGLGIGVQLVEAQILNCTFPELETEVEIFPVPTEIGLSVQPGCLLWFYYENHDVYTEAPLE